MIQMCLRSILIKASLNTLLHQLAVAFMNRLMRAKIGRKFKVFHQPRAELETFCNTRLNLDIFMPERPKDSGCQAMVELLGASQLRNSLKLIRLLFIRL